MKKYTIILGFVLLIFGLVMISILFFDSKLQNDPEFREEIMRIAMKEENERDTHAVGNMFETEVSQKNVQIKNATKGAANPEQNQEGDNALRVDAVLSSEDWDARLNAGISTGAVISAKKECEELYYFRNLDEFDKQLYSEIYILLKNYNGNVCLCSLDADKIDMIFTCVLCDHPEIFYSNGYVLTKYSIKDEVARYGFSPMYTMEKSEAEECKKYVDEYTRLFMTGIDKYASEYEKIKYTYEFIIVNTEYDINSPENQNILSVMLYGRSVCQGYSRAVQYLLSNLGISSTVVSGYVENGEGHAWNLVKCNNAYYYLDSTWGDSSFSSNAGSNSFYDLSYDYLNITTADLEKNHIIDNILPLPKCVFTEENYFIKEGKYFDSLNSTRLESVFRGAYNEGRSTVSIKCSSKQVLDEIMQYLITDSHIFDYLSSSAQKVEYCVNEDLFTISFSL